MSTRSPLSPPFPFSSLPNSVNLFVCSRLWRTLRELITGWICLSPFDSPFILLLEKAIATHSSTLAWRIPWTQEPGRLQSVGSLRVGHDWETSLHFTLSSWPPLSPSFLFSSLCNSMNICKGSRLWRAHRKWLLASLLSPLLIPTLLQTHWHLKTHYWTLHCTPVRRNTAPPTRTPTQASVTKKPWQATCTNPHTARKLHNKENSTNCQNTERTPQTQQFKQDEETGIPSR